MRPLRTIAYWIRCLLRPSSVRWRVRDNDEWEWECRAEEDAG
jgi:hypothetical protein